MKGATCKDIDGNIVKAGDTVDYFSFVGCGGESDRGVVWTVADMNEKQTNMPYIRGKGAWSPKAIRKVIDEN